MSKNKKESIENDIRRERFIEKPLFKGEKTNVNKLITYTKKTIMKKKTYNNNNFLIITTTTL